MSQTIGTVRVTVNPGNTQRVKTISYLTTPGNFIVGQAKDVIYAEELTSRSVMTYDKDTEKFVVQDVPRIDGGTF